MDLKMNIKKNQLKIYWNYINNFIILFTINILLTEKLISSNLLGTK